jgi:hypothetical protein
MQLFKQTQYALVWSDLKEALRNGKFIFVLHVTTQKCYETAGEGSHASEGEQRAQGRRGHFHLFFWDFLNLIV